MTGLEEKIGQMLLLGFRGLEIREQDPIVRDLRELNLGGVILFDYDVALGRAERNIASPEQVRELNAELRRRSKGPLLIAVDQEGGEVARLKTSCGFPATKTADELGRGAVEETRKEGERTARVLEEAGFNLNFAPCVDLNRNPTNPIIAGKRRSFGREGKTVVAHAREVIRAHQERGIGCAIKHFPGHGSSRGDTHHGFVDVTGDWEEEELEPFAELIGGGECWGVMTAHVFHARLDPKWPATLSDQVVEGMLRKRCGFDGVVFSDDLEMEAIRSRYPFETVMLRTIQAGIDVLVFANNTHYQPEIGRRAVETISRLVRNGQIAESRIDQSYRRIQELKMKVSRPG